MSPLNRRNLFRAGAATAAGATVAVASPGTAGALPGVAAQVSDGPTGPMTGDVGPDRARIWARPGASDRTTTTWQCTVRAGSGAPRTVRTTIAHGNDETLLFDVSGLGAGTAHTYEITPVGATAATPMRGSFRTAPRPGDAAVITMGLGSCAPDGPNTVWDRIVAEGCDSFVMLGDTPYIDSGDLAVARAKQRTFLQTPQVADLISRMPVWATWDDHDFGGNDTAGDFAGKANTRRAFVDYRANATFGHDSSGRPLTGRGDGLGVYTSFRRGPVEVFLLDPRWFSRTESSFADPARTTFIGRVQWEWLQQRLSASTATFKILASGAIWDDKGNSESDDWGTYSYERAAIERFVREKAIPGCLLLGGDIHVSRALNYGSGSVGYDLWQFIVSPLHDRTIPSLNVANPALVASAVEPYTFLKLVADTTVSPARLTATWINRDGRRLFEVQRTATQMGYAR